MPQSFGFGTWVIDSQWNTKLRKEKLHSNYVRIVKLLLTINRHNLFIVLIYRWFRWTEVVKHRVSPDFNFLMLSTTLLTIHTFRNSKERDKINMSGNQTQTQETKKSRGVIGPSESVVPCMTRLSLFSRDNYWISTECITLKPLSDSSNQQEKVNINKYQMKLLELTKTQSYRQKSTSGSSIAK